MKIIEGDWIRMLFIAMLLISMVIVVSMDAQDVVEDNKNEPAEAPWIEGVDDFNRLSADELLPLAEQNETVRKLVEESRKIHPVQIESLEDLENLPDNYPEDIKKIMIEDYYARLGGDDNGTIEGENMSDYNNLSCNDSGFYDSAIDR
ncbi:hypothetical protein [Methanococcoides methylutens]|uniref:hypothetical protein n=1 Tax=Methanococcoides methylutens TaxID=2226 RepID=UPI0006944499|nr:hypothetical protein [Methanococcoides methylutens]